MRLMTYRIALLSVLLLSTALPTAGPAVAGDDRPAAPQVPAATTPAVFARTGAGAGSGGLDDLDDIMINDTRSGTVTPTLLAAADFQERGPRLGTIAATDSDGAPDEGGMVSVMPRTTSAAPRVTEAALAAATRAAIPEPSAVADETGYAVHLASYRTAEPAERGWHIYRRQYPDLLTDLDGRGVPVTLPGKGDYIRLLAGPFRSAAEAADVCAALERQDQYCKVMMFDGGSAS